MRMRAPCDCGEPQAEFEDAVCAVLESDGSPYEILDRNYTSDPFEPDIVLMNEDEWVFRMVCYYTQEEDGQVDIFPRTFPMRKWVTDHDDLPTYFVLGVNGTPQHPEYLYLCRFFEIASRYTKLESLRPYLVNCFRPEFFSNFIEKDLDRIFSA